MFSCGIVIDVWVSMGRCYCGYCSRIKYKLLIYYLKVVFLCCYLCDVYFNDVFSVNCELFYREDFFVWNYVSVYVYGLLFWGILL